MHVCCSLCFSCVFLLSLRVEAVEVTYPNGKSYIFPVSIIKANIRVFIYLRIGTFLERKASICNFFQIFCLLKVILDICLYYPSEFHRSSLLNGISHTVLFNILKYTGCPRYILKCCCTKWVALSTAVHFLTSYSI